jgi:cytochrome c peroxidase
MRWLSIVLFAACDPLGPLPEVDPPATAQEEAQRTLGHRLFFDTSLSGAGDVSCASCHAPERYGTDGKATSIGTGGAVGARNAPSTFNAALKRWQFWDARADSLEAQAEGPLFAPDEMGTSPEALVDYVAASYPDLLESAYPQAESVEVDHVTLALAAYQRTLPAPSRFDRYLRGDRSALHPTEREGLQLFRNNCAFCHTGEGIGGARQRVLGDEEPWPNQDDLGRFQVTGDDRDRMVFVVPSLRNVAQTAPYFHDGSVATLDEAVRLMARHQLGERMPDNEVSAIVAFLGALDAETVPPWAFAPSDADDR